jgi:DNA helicase-2/ATP-dependent DNA helicase PcrA
MADSSIFDTQYTTLNPAQRKAVDTVEGPVLVVAGPGTGKTHILTLRIANILRQTQANPSNILALTFTDSAARTMRRRLAGIVGEEVARQVTIATFHGFCELVLSRYPEHFGESASHRLMGDVEQVLLMRDAIESVELKSLRPPKAPYTYLDDLKSLYDQLVREGVSLEAYAAWGEEERERIRNDASLLRKRDSDGGKAGTLTAAGQEKLERIDKIDEAVRVLRQYEALKDERGVYDFTDMLRVVIGRIGQDESLRADLQEQYQYILADEHQDANALQHRLLELFALQQDGTLDEFPNIFAVGDEKQAIYRFQGADLTQFRTFTEIFPRAEVITLTSSFRSYQSVLDVAHDLVASILGESAESQRLSAHRGAGEADGPAAVSLIVGTDPLDERAKITELVARLIDQGTAPHEIAVISRKNETADLIAAQLEARGLPVLRAGDVSLTSRPLVHSILSLLHYVADPTRLDALRRALLAPWWPENKEGASISVADILLFLRTTRDSELLAQLRERWPGVAATLEKGIEKSTAQTPIECFSYLFTESGARSYLLSHAEHLDDIALVRQLIQHLEDAAQSKEGSNFRDAMDLLIRAGEHEMSPVKTSVTEREGFVTVITAHKAKGMEFQHVVIPDLTENGWEKGGKPAMIPSPFDTKQALDDVRRLFYVALTRAKDHAYLTYAQESKDGRERKMSVLMPTNIPLTEIESSPLPLLHQTVNAPEVLTRLAKQYITEDGLSPSALSEYLKSPSRFFACRVLRMKEPPKEPMVLGNAVHDAIAMWLSNQGVSGARRLDDATAAGHASIERQFRTCLLPRGKVFKDLLAEAHALFDAYVEDPLPQGKAVGIEKAYKLKRVVDGTEVMMQGKVDAIFETSNGICVVDWKTGSQVSAKNEDYIRQLMMYAYLIENDGEPMPVKCASLIAISKDGVKEIPVPVTNEARQQVLDEFDQVAHELLTGEWRKGIEPSEYDDLLKLFQ